MTINKSRKKQIRKIVNRKYYEKNKNRFQCDLCKYPGSTNQAYNKHLMTKKHKHNIFISKLPKLEFINTKNEIISLIDDDETESEYYSDDE